MRCILFLYDGLQILNIQQFPYRTRSERSWGLFGGRRAGGEIALTSRARQSLKKELQQFSSGKNYTETYKFRGGPCITVLRRWSSPEPPGTSATSGRRWSRDGDGSEDARHRGNKNTYNLFKLLSQVRTGHDFKESHHLKYENISYRSIRGPPAWVGRIMVTTQQPRWQHNPCIPYIHTDALTDCHLTLPDNKP